MSVCLSVFRCLCISVCVCSCTFSLQFAADSNASLVLTLYHPDSHVRVGALRHLKKLLAPSQAGDSSIAKKDHEFVSSAILARLRDDDPVVVKATLELGPQVRVYVCVCVYTKRKESLVLLYMWLIISSGVAR